MGKMTATAVKAAKAPGRYGDGKGLFLIVGKRAASSWVVRVQKNGRRRDIGLGSASKVSLSRARELAETVRSQVEAGIDPVAERRKAKGIPTFREAAATVFDANSGKWSNGKHLWQWKRTLEMFVYPAIGDTPIKEQTFRDAARTPRPAVDSIVVARHCARLAVWRGGRVVKGSRL